MGINHITLVGQLVRSPEMRMTPNGIATTQFSVAVTRPPRQEGVGKETTDFIRIVTWRKLAETVNETIKKGDMVSIEGRLLTRTFEQNGQRRKIVEVEAQSVEAIRVGAPAQAEPESFAPELEETPGAFKDEMDEIPF
jgi:single-strand DNA-binding protein